MLNTTCVLGTQSAHTSPISCIHHGTKSNSQAHSQYLLLVNVNTVAPFSAVYCTTIKSDLISKFNNSFILLLPRLSACLLLQLILCFKFNYQPITHFTLVGN